MTDSTLSTTRRSLLVGAAGGLVAASAQAAPQALAMTDLKKEADVACLYHCDYGAPERFAQTLNNISNHYSVYGADPFSLQLVIVAHSAAVKFFLSSLEGSPWKDETLDPALFERPIVITNAAYRFMVLEQLAEIGLGRHPAGAGAARFRPGDRCGRRFRADA